ncbi:MAG: C40 family peptidase [Coriobacteriia bacterium]
MRVKAAYLRTPAFIACGILLIASLASPAFGVPATPEIGAKQAEALAAQAELDRMNHELEVLIEEYNAITEALDLTRDQIRLTQRDLERAEMDLSRARRTLSDRVTSIYKHRGFGMLDVFLGARTFEDLVVRMDLAARISRSDAELVAAVKAAKAAVEESERALQQRQAEQLALQAEAASRASRIEADVASQQRFVGELEAEVQALIAAEQERQRQLAAERARLAAEAAARASVEGARSAASNRAASDPSSLGAGHPAVVEVTLGFLGVRYVWGGSTPSGFDCSGLTQYCYRQVGVSIPRTSQSQYNAGQHIDRQRLDLLKPGDLVFFGTDGDANRVHHVGMYVGDGNYVHAPYTGAVVRVDSLTARISSRGDYVGASRF